MIEIEVALTIPRPLVWLFANGVIRDAWPVKSTKLEDYEAFLRRYVGQAQREAIPELRLLWLEWHTETGLGRVDLALAAWRDYALHLRDCPQRGTRPCPRAEALFARAVRVSEFQGLTINERDPFPCNAPGPQFLSELDELTDQDCTPSDVTPEDRPVARGSLPPKSLRRKP